MKYLLASLLFLLPACAPSAQPPPATSASPANPLVGRWRSTAADGGTYEFTASGKILVEGGGMVLTGQYDQLSGDRCLEKLDSGDQYRFLCKVDRDTLTIQHENASPQTYRRE